ncbi:hypothetical protein AUP68_17101 [Ilyonectria robusta]
MGWTYNVPGDPPTTGPQITSLAIVFTAVALLTVSLRVYVRGFMLKAFGIDDWIIIATWVGDLYLGLMALLTIDSVCKLWLRSCDDYA